jgi:hypothetical protein
MELRLKHSHLQSSSNSQGATRLFSTHVILKKSVVSHALCLLVLGN